MSTSTQNSKERDRRKPIIPPEEIGKDMTLFDYLLECREPEDLAKRLVDISLSKSKVPMNLRDEAAQEIMLAWAQIKPDTKKYEPSQIAAYAHMIGQRTALRVRREMGSPVRLPGSAFRKRKDGSSYVTPGVLSNALSWDDLESWFNTSDFDGFDDVGGNPGMSDVISSALEASTSEEEPDDTAQGEAVRQRRESLLEQNARNLTRQQLNIMFQLIEGRSFDQVADSIQMKRSFVVRQVAVSVSLLGGAFAAGAGLLEAFEAQ